MITIPDTKSKNIMRGIAGWLMGRQSDEERSKIATMTDTNKTLKKRFAALSQLFKMFDKFSHGGYSERLEDFLKMNWKVVTEISLMLLEEAEIHLRTRARGACWEEISVAIRILIEITRYGYMNYAPYLSEICQICLYDDNRMELKDLGFALVLELLNHNENSEVPFYLLLSTIDFAEFKSEEDRNLALPDRSGQINASSTQAPWLILALESLRKVEQSVPYPEPKDFEKFVDITFTEPEKECLYYMEKVLEFSLDSGVPPSVRKKEEHFKHWFQLLKKSLLFLLYPQFSTPFENISPDLGFHKGAPPELHYMIVNWLVRIIKDPDLLDILFATEENYEYICSILATSFRLTESYRFICYKTASKCISLYEGWIFETSLPRIVAENTNKHIKTILGHTIQIFDFSRDKSKKRVSLCNDIIKILKVFRSNCRAWPTLLESSYLLAEQLSNTHSSSKELSHIVEPMAEYILSTLSEAYKHTKLDWKIFSRIMKRWARFSVPIADVWKDIMMRLSEDLKTNKFENEKALDAWLSYLHILGEPLKFSNRVQFKWAESLKELIHLIVNPPHLSANTNKLLNFFFFILSKLIRKGSNEETEIIALESLFMLFINTRSEELPMKCYFDHFAFIIEIGTNLSYFNETILSSINQVLMYNDLHCLIPSIINIAFTIPTQSLEFAFSIMSYPNYYKQTTIESLNGETQTYLSIKPSIKAIFQSVAQDEQTAIIGLYGLTTHLIEELKCGNGDTEGIFHGIILEKCCSESDECALTALHCLRILSKFMPGVVNDVIKVLVGKLLVQISIHRENVIKSVFHSIEHWLMSSPYYSHFQIENLFVIVSQMLQKLPTDSELVDEIDNLSIFLTLFLSNFPLKNEGTDIIQSVEEEETGSIKHFSFGDNVVVSLPYNSSSSKAVLRNAYGKFYWESTHFKVFEPSSLTEETKSAEQAILSTKMELKNKPPPETLKSEDLIQLLIQHTKSEHPELTILDESKPPRPDIYKFIDDMEKTEANSIIRETSTPQPESHFNQSRLFLAHTGILEQLIPLESSERLERGLNLLDGENPRVSIKFGVTYVKPFQQFEKEILQNNSGPAAFQEFVEQLGTLVNLKTHTGNLGGLDTAGTCGEFTVSYSDWENDIIFHVVSLMPSNFNDDEQLLKKRHVGNDIVNIVWSDDYRDYRVDTILTHLNLITIVIYPLEPKLFRISVLKKVNVNCGPLEHGMVVPWEVLAPLVRETATDANHKIRLMKHASYEGKASVRKRQIEELINRYAIPSTPEHEVYSSII